MLFEDALRKLPSVFPQDIAVGVAQLVEHRVVAPVVVGSSPITHPIIIIGQTPSVIGKVPAFDGFGIYRTLETMIIN